MLEERFDEDFSNPDNEPVNDDIQGIELDNSSDDISIDPDEGFQGMQDRMTGDIEPWYSESVNKVVDQDGNDILDKDGKPFRSMEDYKKSITEKPEEKTDSKPVTTFSGSEVTFETLNERAEAGKGFNYNDELLPRVEPPVTVKGGMPPPEAVKLDPVTQVKAMHKTWTSIAVQPIRDVAASMVQALVSNGADQNIAANIVNQVITPMIQKQSEAIDALYKEEYEKAVYNQLESKISGRIGEADSSKINAQSEKNLDELSKIYYPKYGKSALFELINGYHKKEGDPSTFTRGQASHIMDLLTSIYKGDKFQSNQEIVKAQNETFRMLTSDRNKANVLFDLIHYYSIGKNFATIKEAAFKQGKEAAKQEEQRIKKTVRQRPTSKRPPTASMDGLPNAIKNVLMSEL